MTNKFLLLVFIGCFASASLCDLIRAFWRVLVVRLVTLCGIIADAWVYLSIVFRYGFFVLFVLLFLEAG